LGLSRELEESLAQAWSGRRYVIRAQGARYRISSCGQVTRTKKLFDSLLLCSVDVMSWQHEHEWPLRITLTFSRTLITHSRFLSALSIYTCVTRSWSLELGTCHNQLQENEEQITMLEQERRERPG
jgi:hypothetical protein